MISRSLYVVLLICIVVNPVKAEVPHSKIVLTSLEITTALCQALTQDSSVRIINVIPAGYSMQGQDAYFKQHQDEFFKVAARADAVVTVGSVWAGDPLFKWARRGNIRLVNIDASHPLDEYGAGVPRIEVQGQFLPFVWRSPANLTKMASIVADDLVRLYPAEAHIITRNLKVLQSRLFQLRSQYEAIFLDFDSVDCAALTGGFSSLADEFGLDIIFYQLKPELEWTSQDALSFSEDLQHQAVHVVICSWEPNARVTKAIKNGGASVVILDRYTWSHDTEPLQSILNWFQGNLVKLQAALK